MSPNPLDISWHELFLEAPVDAAFNEYYMSVAQSEGRAFKENLIAPTAAVVDQANAWYASTAGQKELCRLVDTIWGRMAKISHKAMPAHDARHAMYKVPASAIFHMQAEGVTGWARVGILGALMHDFGRWAEERLFGGPGEGVLHARLSFLLCSEILMDFDIPPFVAQELLRCPLDHTTGANPQDPMPLKLTVSADRDQLYGPEIVLRLAHHGIADSLKQTSFYGEKPGTAVLDRLHFFHNNRLPGPLFALNKRVGVLQETLRAFLLIAEPFEVSLNRWVLTPQKASTKAQPSTFLPEQWEGAWAAAQKLAPTYRVSADAPSALFSLLTARHVAPANAHLEVALEKLSDLPKNRNEYLTNALDFITERLHRLDQHEHKLLTQIGEHSSSDDFVQRLTSRLLDQWPGA